MAAELESAFPETSPVILTPGSNGIFDVVVDGARVFSKGSAGRFPHPGEVVEALRERDR
ncbi:hypothetical protein BH23VER1_BH23VER1_20510 [soil metagenome]